MWMICSRRERCMRDRMEMETDMRAVKPEQATRRTKIMTESTCRNLRITAVYMPVEKRADGDESEGHGI